MEELINLFLQKCTCTLIKPHKSNSTLSMYGRGDRYVVGVALIIVMTLFCTIVIIIIIHTIVNESTEVPNARLSVQCATKRNESTHFLVLYTGTVELKLY